MSAPAVYPAIVAVAAELTASGIAKSRSSVEGSYFYRGIDDLYAGLSPLLAKHSLCVLPRVLDRECVSRKTRSGDLIFAVTIRAAFDLIAAKDGSCHSVESYGEALDGSDKATAKAMSAAYKSAMFQVFCIPTGKDSEADIKPPLVRETDSHGDTPVQGWEQWSIDIADLAKSCETVEAITRLQQTYRYELRGLSQQDPLNFAVLGRIFQEKRDSLSTSLIEVPLPQKRSTRNNKVRPKVKARIGNQNGGRNETTA